jgi:hypothetical protein
MCCASPCPRAEGRGSHLTRCFNRLPDQAPPTARSSKPPAPSRICQSTSSWTAVSDHHLWPPSGAACTSMRSTVTLRCSPTSPLPPSTTPPACRRELPSTESHRRGAHSSGENLPVPTPQMGALRCRAALAPLCYPLATGSPENRRRRRHLAAPSEPPLFRFEQPSQLIWAGQFRPDVNSSLPHFPVNYIQIIFKCRSSKIHMKFI